MNDKIQELTDKLYAQGLSKGKEEGERLVQQARKCSDEIISQARAEAESIVRAAEETAAMLKSKAESDVRMASEQAMAATRQAIENLIDTKICKEPVSSALSDPDFLKSVISAVAGNFSAQESRDIELLLPGDMKEALNDWVGKELAVTLSSSVSAKFSSKIKGGFNIGPKDGAWFISFTDETLFELIGAYLRPVTRKLLFGE